MVLLHLYIKHLLDHESYEVAPYLRCIQKLSIMNNDLSLK